MNTDSKVGITDYEFHQRRVAWRMWTGLPIVTIGLLLCALTGVQDNLGRIMTVPAASVGTIMIVVGFYFVIRALYIDVRISRRYFNRGTIS